MTKVVAIFGDPVAHSRSPAMHNAAFRALGLDWVYVAHRVAPRDLARAVAAIRLLEYAGLNVTVPHKERILPLLDALTPGAREIGAVNTVLRKGSELYGDNTDAEGFRRALASLGFRPRGKTAIVLGAGGSARAVVWTLTRGGVRSLLLLNRTESRARGLRAAMADGPGRIVEIGPPGAALDPAIVGAADLVVNCTSLGLDGRSMPPLDLASTRRDCVVYDLVYGEKPTPLVREAKRLGRVAADGRRMLLEQAGLAFRAWTGRKAPLDAMAKALR